MPTLREIIAAHGGPQSRALNTLNALNVIDKTPAEAALTITDIRIKRVKGAGHRTWQQIRAAIATDADALAKFDEASERERRTLFGKR